MKNMTKRVFSLVLALVMVLSVVPMSAFAAGHDHAAQSEAVVDNKPIALVPSAAEAESAAKGELPDFSFASVLASTLLSADDVKIDETNPEIQILEAELSDVKVLGAEGDPVPLTEEQKATLVALYQQYVDHRNANADVLGVQVPFYLQYNDDVDELGPLGEVLSLAGIPLEAVRAGQVAYADLEGMLMIFYFTDVLGVQFYGDAIKAARDEALQAIVDSGAQTDAQKLLVLNDWLAEVCTFDMPYIMGEDTMKAQDPQPHRYYQHVYDALYSVYEENIHNMFLDEFKAAIEADMRNKFYIEVVKSMVADGYLSAAAADEQMIAGARQGFQQAVLETLTQQAYDEAYAAYATHEHDLTVTWTWAEDLSAATASAVCETGLESYEAVDAVITTVSTATCTEAGTTTYTATATIAGVTVTDSKVVEVEKLGHDFDDNFVCTRCHTTAEGHEHQYTTLVNTVAPTCTEAGSETYACDCGEEQVTTVPAIGHDYKGEVTAAPTCTEAGEMTYTCANCQDSYTTEQPATGHRDTNEDGICDVCNETIVSGEAVVLAAEGDEIDPDADRYAKAQVEAQKAELEAAAAAAAEAATEEDLKPIINTIVYGAEDGDPAKAVETDLEKDAAAYAANFATENEEALNADARGFAVNMLTEQLGEEAAAGYMTEIDAQCDAFIEDAKTNGVEVDPVNAPGYKMTIDQIAEQQMATEDKIINMGTEEQPYMCSPSEAVALASDQAAAQSADGVLNFWEGSHFGALGEGKAVCLGYSDAYAYLMQCLYADYYTNSGDYKNAADWKTDVAELYYTDGQLDVDKGYYADLVRISFATEVTMFGQVQPDFNSDHFWNAVRIDGDWYYVDPCYTDVYVEVMMRDRAETDGNVNHLYFMFSHDSAVNLYDGYYSQLKTLYDNAANDTRYEDSWTARIVSDTTFDGGYAYYVYSSSDMITLLDDFNNDQMNTEEYDTNYEFKLVRHALDTSDIGDGDNDYEALIEFNHLIDEDAEETVTRVYNPTTGEMEENAFLTALYAQYVADMKVYPSLAITCALDGNLLYFNLSNYLLAYDLTTGDIIVVKEYTTVGATRDKTNAFGAMAFSVTNESPELTVENHPIAGIILKEDGKLYVSVATNFSFISGKETDESTHETPEDPAANGEYGYEYEESNYNPNYNSFGADEYEDNNMYESMGYEKEINDNDEFMWTANFVEIQAMENVAVTPCAEHTYETVSVAANCEHNAYTVNMCQCGAVENGTYAEEADTIHNHHYVYFAETYYTKDDDNQNRWNSGECYVCTECGFSIEEPTEPQQNSGMGDMGPSYEEQYAQYEKELAIWNNAVATVGHEYSVTDAVWSADYTAVTFSKLCCDHCKARKANLDCLLNDNTIETSLSTSITADASVAGYTGDCTEGAVATYAASGTLEIGGTYYVSTDVKLAAGNHAYEIEATWNLVADEEGNAVLDENGNEQFTVDAALTCAVCGHTHTAEAVKATLDTENSYAPTCTEAGANVYTATIVAKNDSGNEIGSATTTHTVEIPAKGHDYVDGICSVCGEIMLTDPVILSCYSKLQTSVKVTWSLVENADGYELYRTATPDDEESWARVKTITSGETDRYTNQDLKKGVTYYYKVRAYIEDAEGNRTYSNFSQVDYMPAAVVWDGPYSNATFRIRLRWDEINGAHGYQIWRLAEDGETWTIVKTLGDKGNELTDDQGATTAYSNTGLVAGESYTYKMRAFMITEDGRKVFGAYSDVYTVAVMPETPVITVTSPKATRAQLAWDEISGAAGYQVWMLDPTNNAGWTIVKSITDGSTAYTKYDLQSGTEYQFKVRAYTEVDGKKTFGAFSEIVTIEVK